MIETEPAATHVAAQVATHVAAQSATRASLALGAAAAPRSGVIPAKAGIQCLLVAASLCVACSSTEPPPPKNQKLVQRDWVMHVRSEAAQVPSAVEVVPLVDPELEDLRATARSEEMRGELEAAAATIDRALVLHPKDPALLQWRAELALATASWGDAERIAQRSYELGPQLGEICVRNWLTIKAARTERGDGPGASSAGAQVASCQVKPPIRM